MLKTRKDSGFTLVEVMLALLVFVTAFMAATVANVRILRATDSSQMAVRAVQDAHTVIERIRNISENGVLQVVAAFPSGGAVAGFQNLANEQVTVTYPAANADPLDMTVTVTWQDRGRLMTRSLRTQVTERI